eukprot:s126_g45.t1
MKNGGKEETDHESRRGRVTLTPSSSSFLEDAALLGEDYPFSRRCSVEDLNKAQSEGSFFEPTGQLSFRDFPQGDRFDESPLGCSQEDISFITSSGGSLTPKLVSPRSVSSVECHGIFKVESSDESPVVIETIMDPSPACTAEAGSLNFGRKASSPPGLLLSTASDCFVEPSSSQRQRRVEADEDALGKEALSGAEEGVVLGAAPLTPPPGDFRVSEDVDLAVEQLLAECQKRASLESSVQGQLAQTDMARGGRHPDRFPSHFESSSQGAAPAERAATVASAEGTRLGFQERGLLTLIYEVFNLLPRFLKAKKSSAVQGAAMEGIFPLPLPCVRLGHGSELIEKWEEGAIRGLNWLVCQSFRLGDGPPSSKQGMLLDEIQKGLILLESWKDLDATSFKPQDLLRQRWINSYGEEVHVAQSVRPPGCKDEEFVLFSRVLPMGFINSVAVAQHLHRRLVAQAFQNQVSSSQEIRRDREFPSAPFYFRTYLDNFDLLSVRSKGILSADEPSLINLLQETYQSFSVPRNTKKAVEAASAAEMQGAWIDGDKGICSSKGDKVVKYLASLNHVLQSRKVSRKQMQMLVGGLVYIFSFRRPLMSILNEVWTFIVSFRDDKQWLPLPLKVQEELVAAFFLSVFSYMNFRLPINPTVTASDASESGGGLTASESLTDWGLKVSKAASRGDSFENFNEQGLLVISLFDGIGALRVALENLKVPLAGYVAIEKDEKASRVVESHFPSCTFCPDVNAVSSADIRAWGAKYPNCCAVLVAGGPPCQGVSGLNASKKGAQDDPRSCLHKAFDRIKAEVRDFFTWCPVFFLMESVASMSLEDRATYTRSSGVLPYKVDARFLSPCRRPRLWWFNWKIPAKENVEVFTPSSARSSESGTLAKDSSSQEFLEPKVVEDDVGGAELRALEAKTDSLEGTMEEILGKLSLLSEHFEKPPAPVEVAPAVPAERPLSAMSLRKAAQVEAFYLPKRDYAKEELLRSFRMRDSRRYLVALELALDAELDFEQIPCVYRLYRLAETFLLPHSEVPDASGKITAQLCLILDYGVSDGAASAEHAQRMARVKKSLEQIVEDVKKFRNPSFPQASELTAIAYSDWDEIYGRPAVAAFGGGEVTSAASGPRDFNLGGKFTRDPLELQRWMGSGRAGRGSPCRELSGAWWAATQLPWKAQKKLALVITDAPCYGKDYSSVAAADSRCDPRTGLTCTGRPEEPLKRLKDQGVVVSILHSGSAGAVSMCQTLQASSPELSHSKVHPSETARGLAHALEEQLHLQPLTYILKPHMLELSAETQLPPDSNLCVAHEMEVDDGGQTQSHTISSDGLFFLGSGVSPRVTLQRPPDEKLDAFFARRSQTVELDGFFNGQKSYLLKMPPLRSAQGSR